MKTYEELEKENAALMAERDALAAKIEALNSKNFELTCYRVDVLRCLKTIAFEHNHSDVLLYQPMARHLMDSISANTELKEVRAEAVEKAANLLRFAPVDGGQKWAVRYVDLLEYAQRVKDGGA